MKKQLTVAFSLAAISAALALGSSALDGGQVHVKTTLNVRTEPSTGSTVKASLYDGQVITIHDKTGNWWHIEYGDGLYGYASASYIQALGLPVATVQTNGSNLNVRSGAGLGYSVKGKLKNGETVLCLGTYGNFIKVLYNGNSVGYVASQYLAVSKDTLTEPINLSITSYKQYDSRWARLTLPGSGESLRTHGCAVTALAMTESYRRGTTVTPANILQSEKFTSTGAIYWPTGYSVGKATDTSFLHANLAAGKPVIVHAKKANGSMHFVVVYGYTGEGLETKNFKVHDPGSETRTTLADFYAVYPYIVKTLVY